MKEFLQSLSTLCLCYGALCSLTHSDRHSCFCSLAKIKAPWRQGLCSIHFAQDLIFLWVLMKCLLSVFLFHLDEQELSIWLLLLFIFIKNKAILPSMIMSLGLCSLRSSLIYTISMNPHGIPLTPILSPLHRLRNCTPNQSTFVKCLQFA